MLDSAEEAVQRPEGHARRDCCTLALRLRPSCHRDSSRKASRAGASGSIRAGPPGGLLNPHRAQQRASLRRWPRLPPRTPHPLTTVVQLGMSLTEFFTSSSVTSTTLQCSSSEGRGSSPFLVTHGCNCEVGRTGRGQTPSEQRPVGMPPTIALREPNAHQPTSPGVGLSPGETEAYGSPTLMSGTPILLSGFLSSIFRIRSLSSSLTFGLKRGRKEMRGDV